MSGIAPGATIGVFGGGQLGRMTALAAHSLGYLVRVLDPDPDCPASHVASTVVAGALDDPAAAAAMAYTCEVVTLEIERVGAEAIAAAEVVAPVRPGASVVHVVQDRARQKRWLSDNGFPVGDYRVVASADAAARAVGEMGPSIIKTTSGGYDGRGQARVADADAARAAWPSLGTGAAVVERLLPLDAELSVLVARRVGGDTAVYPVSLNHHDAGVLTWSAIPAPVEASLADAARSLGTAIAERIGVVGVLAIELFVVGGKLLVNELAPRPHNTFHGTERACLTSQFEQLVRAVCDLPLGGTGLVRPTAILNLLGDRWMGEPPDIAAALADPVVRVHLYGKREARPGRKMGHLSASAATADEALAAVLAAGRRLERG